MLCRSNQRQTFFREYKCEELCWFRSTRIPADLMRAARLLIKHLSGGVGYFLLTGDFSDDFTFKNVHEYESGARFPSLHHRKEGSSACCCAAAIYSQLL